MTTSGGMIGSARRPAAAVAVAAVVGLLALTQSPSQAVVQPSGQVPSAAPAYGTWTALSPAGVDIDNIDQTVIARFGPQYQVEWGQYNKSAGQYTLVTRLLGSNGRPLTGLHTVVGPYPSIDNTRALIAVGAERVTLYTGITANAALPLTYTVSTDGGLSWKPSGVPLTPDEDYGSFGIAAVNAGGTPIAATDDGATVDYSRGLAGAPGPGTGNNGKGLGGFTEDLGLGYDPKTKTTWAAWWTLGGSHDGYYVQEFAPALGPIRKMPGPVVDQDPGQAFSLAARPTSLGGGLYVAYPVEINTPKVALWRIGTKTPLYIPTAEADFAGVAAGTGGRIWVFWRDKGSTMIKFARTNTAGTRLGAVGKLPNPVGVTYFIWDMVGDGTTGPLQLAINAEDTNSGLNRVWSAQVLPWLSATVSPAKVSYAKGGKVTVTLTDAGAAVSGASVTCAGTTRKTSAHGQVTFIIPARAKKGRHAITYSSTGYSPGSASFTISLLLIEAAILVRSRI